MITKAQLAIDILTMAANGGMPDTYWHTDRRIGHACDILDISPDEARELGNRRKVVNR